MSCPAENIFEKMECHLKDLSNGVTLSKADDRALRNLLDEYWGVVCPTDQPPCNRDICNIARKLEWAEYHGYKTPAELLESFEYRNVKVLRLKDLPPHSIHWSLRKKGHFNP
jgi:hypothetical protein